MQEVWGCTTGRGSRKYCKSGVEEFEGREVRNFIREKKAVESWKYLDLTALLWSDISDFDDFKKILTIPQNAITTQYQALLKVDNIDLEFTEDAIETIAEIAEDKNETSENIGARRLQTIMELLLEDISFNASDENPMIKVVVDRPFVLNTMKDVLNSHDFKKYIL